MNDNPAPASREGKDAAAFDWRAALGDLVQMLRFYSRLPVPALPFEHDPHAMPDFRRSTRALPIAGAIIGLPSALMLGLASTAGLPPAVAAALAVAMAALVSGAFHEDGLADTFDGLGGGTTPERRLEIMKDSRVGAFGATALILTLLLRWSVLAALIPGLGGWSTALVVILSAALSRTVGLLPIVLLPPATQSGISAAVGRPTGPTFLTAVALSGLLAVALGLVSHVPFGGLMLGMTLAFIPALLLSWWAVRTIRGQTGDIAGAAQQLAEIAFGVGLLISLTP